MPTPVLVTKLFIPRPRPTVVSRPRLIERLNEGLHRKMTLISAPAGFGKTTLVSAWVEGIAGWFDLVDPSPVGSGSFLAVPVALFDIILLPFWLLFKASGYRKRPKPGHQAPASIRADVRPPHGVDLLAAFLVPDLGKGIHSFAGILPAIGEVRMVGHLLVLSMKTVKTVKPDERIVAAAKSPGSWRPGKELPRGAGIVTVASREEGTGG